MRDGNYVFVSSYGLSLLNNYFVIVEGLEDIDNNVCIVLDEITNSGYTTECPFWYDEKDGQENTDDLNDQDASQDREDAAVDE